MPYFAFENGVRDLIHRLGKAEAAVRAFADSGGTGVPPEVTPHLLKQTQDLLMGCDTRYRRLLERLSALVFELKPDGTVLFVNDAAVEFTGYKPEELTGRNWGEIFFSSEDRKIFSDLIERLQTGDVENYRVPLTHRNSRPVILELTTANAYSEAGKLECITGFAVGVSEHSGVEHELLTSLDDLRASEEALRQQNAALVHAQKNAYEERRRYQELFEFATYAYLVTNRNGVIQEANQTITTMLDIPGWDLLGKPLAIYISEDERGSFHRMLNRLDSTHQNRGWETHLQTREGRIIPVTLVASPIRDEKEKVQGFRWMIHDISPRKQAEARLAYQAHLLDQVNDAIVATDENLVFTAWNKAAEQIFGWEADEILGTSGQKLLREILGGEEFERALAVLGQNGSFQEEIDLRRKDKTLVSVEIKASPLYDDAGRIHGYVSVGRDVTGRRRAEREQRRTKEALDKSEARLRGIFKASSLGIGLTDLEGRWLEVNPALSEMLGYTAEELLKINLFDLIHPDDLSVNQATMQRFSRGEINHFHRECRFLTRDKRVLWVRAAVSLMRSADGEPEYTLGILENISERKQIEAELDEVKRRLLDSVEMERLYLAQELHDGPMQELYGISYKLKGLQEALPEEDVEEDLLPIQGALQQVIQMLRSVAGELRPPSLAPFGLEKAIHSHANQFQREHPEINIRLEMMPDGQMLSERVRLALFRIYQHSMANIIRHARASTAAVRLFIDAEAVYLEVEDNGRGFEVPERWIGLVREGHLGLAGAAERAEALGGILAVDSTPGEGTLVRVTVPLTADRGTAVEKIGSP